MYLALTVHIHESIKHALRSLRQVVLKIMVRNMTIRPMLLKQINARTIDTFHFEWMTRDSSVEFCI